MQRTCGDGSERFVLMNLERLFERDGYFYYLNQIEPDLNACSLFVFAGGWGGLETEARSNTRTSPRARRHFGQLLSREKWPFDHGKNRFKACFGLLGWKTGDGSQKPKPRYK